MKLKEIERIETNCEKCVVLKDALIEMAKRNIKLNNSLKKMKKLKNDLNERLIRKDEKKLAKKKVAKKTKKKKK